MSIPNWYELVLLALAAWRVFHLLSYDSILDQPRNLLCRLPANWQEGDPIPRKYRATLAEFLQCAWCLGFWVSLAWWGSWLLTEKWSVTLAVPFALSAVVALVHQFSEHD